MLEIGADAERMAERRCPFWLTWSSGVIYRVTYVPVYDGGAGCYNDVLLRL